MCLVRELNHSQVLCADAVCTVQPLAGHISDEQAPKLLYLPEMHHDCNGHGVILAAAWSTSGAAPNAVCIEYYIFMVHKSASAARMLACKTACNTMQCDAVTYRHLAFVISRRFIFQTRRPSLIAADLPLLCVADLLAQILNSARPAKR